MSVWAVSAAVVGWFTGHAIRRSVPMVLGMKDRALPFRRPWVEGAGAVVFALVWIRFGWTAQAAIWCVFATLLIAITATDYLVKLIPDRLTFSGALIGMILHAIWPMGVLGISDLHPLLPALAGISPDGPWAGLLLSASGAALGMIVLEAVRWIFSMAVGMQVMGMGDSKLLMMMGAFLGPVGAFGALAAGFLFGVIHGLMYLRISGQPHSPFGPPLAGGGLMVVLGKEPLTRALESFRQWVLVLPLGVLAAIYTLLILVVVVLLIRTRRRAAQYEELIEEDYRQVDEQLE